MHYRVRWQGKDSSEDTWEREEDLPPEFLDKWKNQPRGRRRRGAAQQIHAMYRWPPGNGRMVMILAEGRNPERYLVKWDPIQNNTWELAEDVPRGLIEEYRRHRRDIERLHEECRNWEIRNAESTTASPPAINTRHATTINPAPTGATRPPRPKPVANQSAKRAPPRN
jgi:hypothetical protein